MTGASGVKRLAICTPVYDGRAHASFFRGLMSIKAAAAREGVETAFMDAGHSANLPRLRNGLAAAALDWGADAILWMDSDIAGNGEDVFRLVRAEKPIVGAAPQRRPLEMGEPARVAFKPLPGGVVKVRGALAEVGGVATAFCLTRREVYEALRGSGVAKPLANRDCPRSDWLCNFFWYELEETPEGWVDDGEDYYFCRKARDAGFGCFIHTEVRPLHHEGRMRLAANFMDVHGSALQCQ